MIRSARALTSVATTDALWAARWRAWTPQPVPRSSERPTGSRIVSWASDVDAGLMPSTWSAPTRFGLAVEPGGQVADHPEVAVVGGVRPDVEPGGHLADGALEDALRGEPVDEAGQGPLGGVEAHRRLQEEQPGQGLERVSHRRYAAARAPSRCGPGRRTPPGPSAAATPS